MQRAMPKVVNLSKSQKSEVGSFCVGQIVQVTEECRAVVDYPGNPAGPIEARSVVDAPSAPHKHNEESIPVLLAFENGDRSLPIIVGIIRDTVYSPTPSEEVTLSMKRPRDASLDGRKIVIEANEEIVLRCGKSSVILSKEGKVVVRGTQIVSRASRTNKIKGASVRIN